MQPTQTASAARLRAGHPFVVHMVFDQEPRAGFHTIANSPSMAGKVTSDRSEHTET